MLPWTAGRFGAARPSAASPAPWPESAGNTDAQGDKTLANSKWGNSVGLFQIRSLRDPSKYTGVDRFFLSDASETDYPTMSAAIDPVRKLVIWNYRSVDANRKLMIYNFATKKFAPPRRVNW